MVSLTDDGPEIKAYSRHAKPHTEWVTLHDFERLQEASSRRIREMEAELQMLRHDGGDRR